MFARSLTRGWIIGLAAGTCVAMMPAATQSAIANGDTRTLSLVHAHTHETITATFLVDGRYDQAVLDKLNWFLRDWRRDEPTKMDPRLFDTVWEVHRESGSQQPIMVMSAYRSPETNAMLRQRSRQVAEHSQHILGRAMDQHYMDVPMSKIRELGMKLQRGGVGFYPTAGTPFVHLDVGGVRHWPRMSYDQLARLFPDGKTVHIPSNGQPLPGYEMARAELETRGDGAYPTATQLKSKSFFAWLFGGGSDEADDNAAEGVKPVRGAAPTRMASAAASAGDAQPGSYGRVASDRVTGGGNFFSTLFSASQRGAETPAPAVAAPPPQSAPQVSEPAPATIIAAQPTPTTIPPQAVALAMTPAASTGNQETASTPAIRDLPVPASLASLPLPPRRPATLTAAETAAPLPPSRPADMVASRATAADPHDAGSAPRKFDLIGGLLASRGMVGLPDVITQGGPARPSRALGYAAVAALSEPTRGLSNGADAVPMPVARPTTLVSTRLDRSNFRVLTRPDATDRTAGRSALGAAVPPLRAVARGSLGAMNPHAAVGDESFQPRASTLTTDRFSGQVVKPAVRAAPTGLRTNVD